EDTLTEATATTRAMMKRRSAFVVRKLARRTYSISFQVVTRRSGPAAEVIARAMGPRSANGSLTFTPMSVRAARGERMRDAILRGAYARVLSRSWYPVS